MKTSTILAKIFLVSLFLTKTMFAIEYKYELINTRHNNDFAENIIFPLKPIKENSRFYTLCEKSETNQDNEFIYKVSLEELERKIWFASLQGKAAGIRLNTLENNKILLLDQKLVIKLKKLSKQAYNNTKEKSLGKKINPTEIAKNFALLLGVSSNSFCSKRASGK